MRIVLLNVPFLDRGKSSKECIIPIYARGKNDAIKKQGVIL